MKTFPVPLRQVTQDRNWVRQWFASDTGSLDSEGSNLESILCLGKSFANDAPVVSPVDAQASERMYQLAEIIGPARLSQVLLDSWWMLLLVMLVLCPKVCWLQ